MYIDKEVIFKIYIILFLSFFIHLYIKIYEAYIVNNLAIDGKKLMYLQDQVAKQEEYNLVLREEYYKLGSINSIMKRAIKIGMKAPTGDNIKFITKW